MSRNYRSIRHLDGGKIVLSEPVDVSGAEVTIEGTAFSALMASLASAARWIGPVMVYALKNQTIVFEADEGGCSLQVREEAQACEGANLFRAGQASG